VIISVASGKGGTGKTMVATSLALALAKTYRVKLLDCDVEEPNSHIFLEPEITKKHAVTVPVPEVDESLCNHIGKCAEVCAYHAIAVTNKSVTVFPELCHGCGACSYFCPENAITEIENQIGIVEEGSNDGLGYAGGRLFIGQPMSPPVIKEVKKRVADFDGITIIDSPPGTSCPVIESIRGSDFCLLVTEPTPFGLNDLMLAAAAVKKLDIPVAVVLNKDGIGDNNTANYCMDKGIPILLKIPFDSEIARLYSRGVPLVQGKPEWQQAFKKLYSDIRRILNA